MSPSPIRNPDRDMDFTLHKYYLLSNEHDLLRQRLSNNTPQVYPMIVPESSSNSPPSTSSTRRTSTSTSTAASSLYNYNYTAPIPALPGHSHSSDESALYSASSSPPNSAQLHADEAKLFDINHQIKATLTELLNAPSVRHDERMRAWVQERLMDAEQELKRQRRRRSSIEREGLEHARAMMA